MRAELRCGLNDRWRRLMLASALGTGLALVLSPWLEAVLAPAAPLSASALQAIGCSKRLEVEVKRSVRVEKDVISVEVTGPEGAKLQDVSSAEPLSGEKEGIGKVKYLIDASLNPFVFWEGVLVKLEKGPCECVGFAALTDFVSLWNIESLGLGKVVEVEGGYLATPEVEGVREYRPGDEPRLIIWKTLYSPGGLRVKELKKVKEEYVMDEGIRTFSVSIGPWNKNECLKSMAASLASYLEKLGLRRVEGDSEVSIVAPGANVPRAFIYLALNPAACVPRIRGFEALDLVREELVEEFKTFEKSLKDKGDVRAVPWSEPPSSSL